MYSHLFISSLICVLPVHYLASTLSVWNAMILIPLIALFVVSKMYQVKSDPFILTFLFFILLFLGRIYSRQKLITFKCWLMLLYIFFINETKFVVEEKELQFRLWSLTIIFPDNLTIDFLSRCNRAYFLDGTWIQDWKVWIKLKQYLIM